MSEPTVVSTIRDEQRDVTYRILAFRELNYQEKVREVAHHLQQTKGKHPVPGSVVTIKTYFGVRG